MERQRIKTFLMADEDYCVSPSHFSFTFILLKKKSVNIVTTNLVQLLTLPVFKIILEFLIGYRHKESGWVDGDGTARLWLTLVHQEFGVVLTMSLHHSGYCMWSDASPFRRLQ